MRENLLDTAGDRALDQAAVLASARVRQLDRASGALDTRLTSCPVQMQQEGAPSSKQRRGMVQCDGRSGSALCYSPHY